jgi:N-acetylglucosaminyldiphosphoundecaprenol N-acetyl-beta-D-mannosaminyltransferase
MTVRSTINGRGLRVTPGQETNTIKSETILGFQIANAGKEACTTTIASWLNERPGVPKFVACANPHSLVIGKRDDPFRAALQDATLVVPDGVGIVLASRILGGAIRERVTGSDIFRAASQLADQKGGVRYFLLGSAQPTLDRVTSRLSLEFPAVEVTGTHSPSFIDEFPAVEDEEIVAAVNSRAADVLWVGMGAPKQEKWVHRNRHRLKVRFIGAIGAVFDFYGQTKKRSPQWALGAGLEWLPRLIREPRRLWRRTFVSAPVFLWLVLQERIRRQWGVQPGP